MRGERREEGEGECCKIERKMEGKMKEEPIAQLEKRLIDENEGKTTDCVGRGRRRHVIRNWNFPAK